MLQLCFMGLLFITLLSTLTAVFSGNFFKITIGLNIKIYYCLMDGSPAKPTLESQKFPTNLNLNIQYGSQNTLKCDDSCSIISYSVSLCLYELVANHFYVIFH